MEGSIKATVGPMTPGGTVSLRDAFAKGATGPVQRQDVSFDGKVSPADAAQKVSQVVEPEQIQAAVDTITAYVESLSRSLSIRVDDRSDAGGGFVVQVQDATTDEVIRQIPSEELLAVSAAISDQVDSLKVMGEEGARGLLLEAVS